MEAVITLFKDYFLNHPGMVLIVIVVGSFVIPFLTAFATELAKSIAKRIDKSINP